MTLVLNGTTGVSAVDGSASTPAIQGNDTNTGMFFPAADTVAIATGGTERARVDSSGNVGIGTSSPNKSVSSRALTVNAASGYSALELASGDASRWYINSDGSATYDVTVGNQPRIFFVNGSERARIDSSGNLLVGTTSASCGAADMRQHISASDFCFGLTATGGGASRQVARFAYSTTAVGSITVGASSSSYNTSSDYRLKDITGPLTSSGEFIDALQPKVGTWKVDGSKFVGFIAHEVQEVSPSTVVGEKDAVDADGNPVMQAMEYGSAEFIANIVAELQSLRKRAAASEALIESLTARIAALEGAAS